MRTRFLTLRTIFLALRSRFLAKFIIKKKINWEEI